MTSARSRSLRHHTVFSLTLVGAMLGSSLVHAQSAPTTTPPPSEAALAARRTLVERAQNAARAGRHQEALTHADAAGRIEMTPSLRLFIAQERAALGMHAAAMEAADQCVRETTRNTTVERRESILATCRQIAHDSQEHVVLVTVNGPANRVDGLVVHVGSRTLEANEVGVPLNVDPGAIVIEATAPGVEAFREQRDGVAGAVLAVALPDRFARPAAATTGGNTTGATTGSTTGSATNTNAGNGSNGTSSSNSTGGNQVGGGTEALNREPVQTPPPVNSTGRTLRIVGPIVGAVGIGLGIGAIVANVGANNRADCANGVADPDCHLRYSPDLTAEIGQYQTLTYALGATGGVLLVGGVTIFIVGMVIGDAPTTTPRATTVVVPTMGPTHAGLSVVGTF